MGSSQLGNLLMSQLQERLKNVNSKDHLRLSTLLDPRFKQDGFPSRDTADEAVEKLKNFLRQ